MARIAASGSTTAKVLIVGILSLLLLVPLNLIFGLVQERAGLAQQAQAQIAAGWGSQQSVLMPMLRFEYSRERLQGKTTVRERAEHFLSPARAQVKAQMRVESRKLGIYSLPIYTSTQSIEGEFDPAQSRAQLEEADTWTLMRTSVLFAPGDLTGLREISKFDLGAAPVSLKPSALRIQLASNSDTEMGLSSFQRPVLSADLPILAGGASGPLSFAMNFELAGVRSLNWVPNAAEFQAEISGDWPHPGFAGGVLPRQREVRSDGFSADWRLLDLSTGMPALVGSVDEISAWAGNAVGVTLTEPGGLYQQNERSAKYGVLVLALTIAALFLTEVLVGVRLHPFHYLLVGLALAVFYLLLLALSEHIGFVKAYLLAAAVVSVMVGGYSAAVLHGWWRGVLSATLLIGLYGFLLVLIRAEELSLLLGAIGLSAILAGAMYLTRGFDWYSSASPPISPPLSTP